MPWGKTMNTAAPTSPSIRVAAKEASPPNARLITLSASTNEAAQPSLPSGANKPAVSPPKA